MVDFLTKACVRALFAAAIFGVCAPGHLQAGESGPKPLPGQTVKTRDVKLDASGSLRVRLVDAQGNGLKNVELSVRSASGVELKSITNEDGQAIFANVRPGVHMIPTGTSVELVRVWTADVAPPKAIDSLAVVVDENVVRGQALPFVGSATAGGTSVSPLTLLTIGSLGLATYATIEAADLQNQVDILSASP